MSTIHRRRCRSLAAIGLGAAMMLGSLLTPARGEDGMTVIEQTPKPSEIMDGSAVAFSLRFDRPIDHERSSLVLIKPKGVRRIRPSLDSEPNVLYATAGRLSPGSYTLRWRARASDGHMLSGSIPLQVRP